MKLEPVKAGQWAVLELPQGAVVQGEVERVTAQTVTIAGNTYRREHVVSAMGPMTIDEGGEVRQNPTRKGRTMATKKKPSAAQLAARKRFAEMARSGVWKKKATKRKANPLTRVKRNSPSQATGKAPSKRLVKRRARTARAPAGLYANPIRNASRAPSGYSVHRAVDGKAGTLLATFPKKADAVQYGKAVVKAKRIAVVIVGKR